LISKYRAVDVLKLLHARQKDIEHTDFEGLLFRFADNYQPRSMNGTFMLLMRDSSLLKNTERQRCKLNSLRHI
jgi:hypothetical protein